MSELCTAHSTSSLKVIAAQVVDCQSTIGPRAIPGRRRNACGKPWATTGTIVANDDQQLAGGHAEFNQTQMCRCLVLRTGEDLKRIGAFDILLQWKDDIRKLPEASRCRFRVHGQSQCLVKPRSSFLSARMLITDSLSDESYQ